MTENASRRGLGRGLSALLEEAAPSVRPPVDLRPSSSPAEAPIALLRRNPDQPRQTFDETELQELTDSIRERGVLQPILVRPAPGASGEYQIVAGERRWRAAQRAGLSTVPVLVRTLDDGEVAEISIIENVQRADLNPMEEALGYRTLLNRFSRTQEDIARRVGKSRSHIANALRLLNLPPTVRAHVEAGRLSAGHARAIAAAPDPDALAQMILDRELTVRQTEALARDASLSPPRPPRAGRRALNPDLRSLEEDLTDAVGLEVKVHDRGSGTGEVRILYGSLEQLDSICRKLSAI